MSAFVSANVDHQYVMQAGEIQGAHVPHEQTQQMMAGAAGAAGTAGTVRRSLAAETSAGVGAPAGFLQQEMSCVVTAGGPAVPSVTSGSPMAYVSGYGVPSMYGNAQQMPVCTSAGHPNMMFAQYGQQIKYGDNASVYYGQPSMYHPQVPVQRMHSPIHSMNAVNIQSYVGPTMSSAVPVASNASHAVMHPYIPPQSPVVSAPQRWTPSPPAGGLGCAALPTVTTSGGMYKPSTVTLTQPMPNSAVFPSHLATPRVVVPSAPCQGQFVLGGQYLSAGHAVPASAVLAGSTPSGECTFETSFSSAAQIVSTPMEQSIPTTNLQAHTNATQYYTTTPMQHVALSPRDATFVEDQQAHFQSPTIRMTTAPAAAGSSVTLVSATATPRVTLEAAAASPIANISAMATPRGSCTFDEAPNSPIPMSTPGAQPVAFAPATELSPVVQAEVIEQLNEHDRKMSAASTTQAPLVDPEEPDVILEEPSPDAGTDLQPATAAGASVVVEVEAASAEPVTNMSEAPAVEHEEKADLNVEATVIVAAEQQLQPDCSANVPKPSSSPTPSSETAAQPMASEYPVVDMPAPSAPTPVLSGMEAFAPVTPAASPQQQQQTVLPMPIFTSPSVEPTPIFTLPLSGQADEADMGSVIQRQTPVVSPRPIEAVTVQRAYSGTPRVVVTPRGSNASELLQQFHTASRPILIPAASCLSSSDVMQQAPVLATTPRAMLPTRCSSGPDMSVQSCISGVAPPVPGLLSAEAIRKRTVPLFTKCSVIQEPGQEVPSIEEESAAPLSADGAEVETHHVVVQSMEAPTPAAEKPAAEKPGACQPKVEPPKAVFNISAEQFELISKGKNLSDREIIELTGIDVSAIDGDTRTKYRSVQRVVSEKDAPAVPSDVRHDGEQPVSSGSGSDEAESADEEAHDGADDAPVNSEWAEELVDEPIKTGLSIRSIALSQSETGVATEMQDAVYTEGVAPAAASSACHELIDGDAAAALAGAAVTGDVEAMEASAHDTSAVLPDMTLNLSAAAAAASILAETPDADAAGGAPPSARGSPDADAGSTTVKPSRSNSPKKPRSSRSNRSNSSMANANKVRRKPFKASTTSASRRMCC